MYIENEKINGNIRRKIGYSIYLQMIFKTIHDTKRRRGGERYSREMS
jgi:hypothetical protein